VIKGITTHFYPFLVRISVPVSQEQNSGQLTLICPCPFSCLYSGSACASEQGLKVEKHFEKEKRQKATKNKALHHSTVDVEPCLIYKNLFSTHDFFSLQNFFQVFDRKKGAGATIPALAPGGNLI
jgi:hypothetical protein